MENLNDLIWTDEENDDGINPQNLGISDACMHEFCLIISCGKGSYITCVGGSASQGVSCAG